MTLNKSYEAVMARKSDVMKKAVGIDYSRFRIRLYRLRL